MLVRLCRHLLRACGFDIKRYTPLNDPNLRRQQAMNLWGINAVVDGGANTGEYARRLRLDGYPGAIHSFEPRSAAFAQLARNCARDSNWTCHQAALGALAGPRDLVIARNGVSSSLLAQTNGMESLLPQARPIARETIDVVRLEDLWPTLLPPEKIPMLKLDVQGAEAMALEGAGRRLASLRLIELEIPLRPLYEDAPGLEELFRFLRSRGFSPVSVEPNSYDPKSASVFEINAIFKK